MSDLLLEYLKTPVSHKGEESDVPIAVSVYGLLRAMLALQQVHVEQFRQAGFFAQAVACVSDYVTHLETACLQPQESTMECSTGIVAKTALPSRHCKAALLFLAEGVTDAVVLHSVLVALPVDRFLFLCQRATENTLVEAAVSLFVVSHSNPLAGLTLSAELTTALLSVLLDRSVHILETMRRPGLNEPLEVAAICRSFRLLTRGQWAVPHIMAEGLLQQRTALIALVQDLLLDTSDSESIGCGTDDDKALPVAALIDVLAVLSGWLDVCWRGLPGSDEAIQQLISSTDDKGIYSAGGAGGTTSGKNYFYVNSDERSSLINALLPIPSAGRSYIRDSQDQFDTMEVGALEDDTGSDDHVQDAALARSSLGEVNVEAVQDASMSGRRSTQEREPRLTDISEVRISQEKLTDFVTEWELDSTREVCEKIITFVGVSRSQPHLESGEAILSVEGMNVEQLAEVLVELIVDERHGIAEVPGALEKCIQLLTDVADIGAAPAAVALGALDSILDTMSSWENMTDSFLMQTCLSALIVLAQRQSSCRKVILNSLDKVDAVLLRVGSPVFLFAAMKLCQSVMSVMNRLSVDGEALVVNWVMRCIRTEWTPLLTCACQFLLALSSVNRPLLFKGFSRRELEEPLIRIVRESGDISTVLMALRTLAVLAANFNERPFWFYESWALPFLSSEKERQLSSVTFMYTLLETKKKFDSPLDLVILSYGLTILTFLEEVPSIRDSEVHTLKFQSIFVPELAKLLSVVSQTHQYVSTNEMHHPVEDDSQIQDFEDSIYQYLLSVELHGLNASYELMCAAAIQTLHALVTYGHFRDLSLYEQYEEEFRETPVCEAVLYIMMQLPHNYIVQTKGIDIVQKLIANGFGARIFGECCSKVLIGAMVAFSDDSGVHRAFCSIVNTLAQRNEFERTRLVSSSVFKWLYIVIKAGSPENAPLACTAIRSIADTEERAEAMGNAGLVKTVVLLLDKHASILKVQVEGLRTIVVLCKSQVCFRQFKTIGGIKRVKLAREFLRSVLAGSSDGQPLPILEQSPYVEADLAELLELSGPGKLGEKCVMS